MTFDLDLVITINLRNELLRSEFYGNVVLEICVRPLVKINIWHYSPLLIMLFMLIMLIKKVAQSCRLTNKVEFVHWSIGNINQPKNLTLLTISRFCGRQLDYLGVSLSTGDNDGQTVPKMP